MSNLDLAKRAVACKSWRWMPGMLTTDGLRVSHNGDQLVGISHDYKRNEWCELGLNGRLPDLDDHATLGCLLAMVRETWGDPVLFVKGGMLFGSPTWTLSGHKEQQSVLRRIRLGCVCDLEAEALVFALEAAPC